MISIDNPDFAGSAVGVVESSARSGFCMKHSYRAHIVSDLQIVLPPASLGCEQIELKVEARIPLDSVADYRV